MANQLNDAEQNEPSAGSLGRDLKQKAVDLADTAATAAKRQVDHIMSSTETAASEVGDKVVSALEDQKAAGAKYINGVAQAIHRSADAFESEVPYASRCIHQAGMEVEAFAEAVLERSPREILGEVERFARRQPAVFFGGAIILGFVALRFLKSAPAESRYQNRS